MMSELHVVVGAGQVGTPLALELLSRGHRVRMIRQSAREALPGVELVRADLADAAAVREATAGATAIYHCANPRYFAKLWEEVLPKWTESLLAGAAASGARLVVLDNVYAFGDLKGQPLNEDAPMRPSSRKGAIRARVAERMMSAHAKGEAKVVIGRASDFFGPGGTLTYFGDQFWPSVLKGKPAFALTDWGVVHTFHYIPDVVAGLATLGAAPADVYGRWWMLPCHLPFVTHELARQLASAAGQELKTMRLPGFMIPVLGLFIKELPEFREMMYQWESVFEMDDRQFRTRFPNQSPTPMEQAIPATVAWARERYGQV